MLKIVQPQQLAELEQLRGYVSFHWERVNLEIYTVTTVYVAID